MKHTIIICVLMTCVLGCSEGEKATIGTDFGNFGELQNEASTLDTETSYTSPIDGITYSPAGGWQSSVPEGGVRRSGDRIQNSLLRFFTGDDVLMDRTTVEAVVDFVERVEDTAQKALSPSTEQATVIAQFSCTPGDFSVELAHQGTLSEDLLNSFHDQLNQLQPLQVSSAEVVFHLTIDIESGR